MKILDRLPISQTDNLVYVRDEPVRIKKSEIIVWLSVTSIMTEEWTASTPRFPAILDTGHTHNFAIQDTHLTRWAGIDAGILKPVGFIRHASKKLSLHAAKIWIHRNAAGSSRLVDAPHCLLMPRGIAIYPNEFDYPRLPLLGLRALLSNELHLIVNGQDASVILRTPDWRTDMLRWLA